MTLYQDLHELQIMLALILGACLCCQPVTLGRLAESQTRPRLRMRAGSGAPRTVPLLLRPAAWAWARHHAPLAP
jgi:hypothetical protein